MQDKLTHAFWHFGNDDEYGTQAKDIQQFIEKINLSKDKVVWCPFDDENSNFVKVLVGGGYKVIHSHILKGQNFYTWEPQEHYDIIISNPPFKGKVNLIKRVLELGKPFAFIFGIQCFNSSNFTELLADSRIKNLQIIFLKERLRFIKDGVVLPRPNFASCWIYSGSEYQKTIDFINNKKEKE